MRKTVAKSYLYLTQNNLVITPRAHGIDISKYDQKFVYGDVTGQLDFIVQRASYRTTTDELFYQMLNEVMKVPVKGAYHYLNSDTDWKPQADKFISLVKNYDYNFYVVDFEAAVNVLSTGFAYQAWQWLHYVKDMLNKPVLLYTSPYIYKDYIVPSQAKYGIDWNTVDLWEAQWLYVPDPNKNPSTVSGRTSGWKMWQYTDSGMGKTLYGTGRDGACDLDVYNGTLEEMMEWLNVGTTLPPEPPVQEEGEWIFKIKPENIVRAQVTGYSSNKTVEYVAQEFHKSIQPGNHSLVINGDGWHTSGVPNGDWVVNGVWKHFQSKDSYSPRITFDSGSKGVIAGARGEYWYPQKITDYNAFGLTRRLVMNGAINPAYHDSGELNSRTGFGFTPDGTLVIYVCDGWDLNSVTGEPPKGKTIEEMGNILIESGCIEAGDGDGGGSVTLAIDGKVINDYNDDGVKVMRPVVNHLCLELNIDPLNGGGEVATDTYITNKNAQTYNSNGAARDPIVPKDTVLVCDWLWPDGALKGMRKIVSGVDI